MSTISFYYGSMGCGKSTYALQLRHTLARAGFKPLLVKPSMDTRDEFVVRSRMGVEHPAMLLPLELDSLADQCGHFTHIICDESQFLMPDNLEALRRCADDFGLQVDLFGLRTDYTGKLFEASAAIMAMADNLVELPMIYKDGAKANMHLRFIDGKPYFGGSGIFVGDIDDEYESVSRREFFSRKLTLEGSN